MSAVSKPVCDWSFAPSTSHGSKPWAFQLMNISWVKLTVWYRWPFRQLPSYKACSYWHQQLWEAAARQLPVTGSPRLCPLLFSTPKITITTASNTHLSTCGLVLKTHQDRPDCALTDTEAREQQTGFRSNTLTLNTWANLKCMRKFYHSDCNSHKCCDYSQ